MYYVHINNTELISLGQGSVDPSRDFAYNYSHHRKSNFDNVNYDDNNYHHGHYYV